MKSVTMQQKFKDKSKKNKGFIPNTPTPFVTRVRIPRGKEVLGVVDQRVGANRMIIKCLDEKERNCRVPGSLRRTLWIRPGDIVIVKPWEFEGDKRGDIIFKYTPTAVEWLKKNGFLKDKTNEF